MPFGDAERRDDSRPAPYRLRSLTPLPGWLLTIGFLVVITVLTITLKRKGTEWGYPIWLQYAALLAFWVGGYLGVGHFVRRPCTWLRVAEGGEVLLTRVWLLRVRQDRIPRAAIATVTVREEEDSEGDPYFRTLLILATGEEITVQEGHRRPRQDAVAAALRRAIGIGR